ncbi:MAG TPA: YiiX/YebB-like N1pC/P60 family cysteine hydrolase [Saprospiraceae bacterium]|nr:YiiX/YebB-like N1pC/P60 family cysteine hydrolase [Saprospiraceae bacterium]
MREGDLLFKDLDCGILCQAIEGVTAGYGGAQISHVGLLDYKELSGQWVVHEAIGSAVQSTPLEDFFKGPLDNNNKPKILLGRLTSKHCGKIPQALNYCNQKIGTPYDNAYLPGEEKLYCSELVQYALGKELIPSMPMVFRHPHNPYYFEAWQDHFRKLEMEIPESKPGTNPGALSRHPEIDILHIFGELDGLTPNK